MMKSRIPLIYLRCLAVVLVVLLALRAVGLSGDVPADSISYDDGPHVFWAAPDSAIVFYLCDGELVKQAFKVDDTLRFNGLCHDSGQSYAIPTNPPVPENAIFSGVTRVFAVSDIHGEYEAFVQLLKAAGIVDDQLEWSWGDGHLVVNGDIFDRGDMVTEALWLVYRLQQEAERAGGKVHYLLGNHETMVLRGDNRYIHEKYLDGIVKKSRIRHEDLYGPDMELGRWLRTRPTAIRIDSILFVHGGISPQLYRCRYRLDSLNALVRATLDVRSYDLAFDSSLGLVYRSLGPFWYRGLLIDMEEDYPMIASAELDSILSLYGAGAVVVGHTEMDELDCYFGGRVYGIDMPLEELGVFQGLLWEGGRFYRVDGHGQKELLTCGQ
jgi:hypothetical protein